MLVWETISQCCSTDKAPSINGVRPPLSSDEIYHSICWYAVSERYHSLWLNLATPMPHGLSLCGISAKA